MQGMETWQERVLNEFRVENFELKERVKFLEKVIKNFTEANGNVGISVNGVVVSDGAAGSVMVNGKKI